MAACTGRKTAALLVYPALQGTGFPASTHTEYQAIGVDEMTHGLIRTHHMDNNIANNNIPEPHSPRGGGAPSGGYWGTMSGNRGGQQWPPLHGNSQNTPFRPPSNPSQGYPDRNQPRDGRSYPSSGRGGGGSYSSSGIY
ncbi:hypothetical protein CEXT_703601 [Caerostris extrusa]|uniref:Uncharacterized protein n=1 Tax=Caerostris extrusa TaxID=172846 RepID=A0AAV4MZ80_CAEEX|nr:hypothetical protein CEXT_703601 [Caerostris extrusa]